jgi:hypothetical protein
VALQTLFGIAIRQMHYGFLFIAGTRFLAISNRLKVIIHRSFTHSVMADTRFRRLWALQDRSKITIRFLDQILYWWLVVSVLLSLTV